jgi:hypothetical protein
LHDRKVLWIQHPSGIRRGRTDLKFLFFRLESASQKKPLSATQLLVEQSGFDRGPAPHDSLSEKFNQRLKPCFGQDARRFPGTIRLRRSRSCAARNVMSMEYTPVD